MKKILRRILSNLLCIVMLVTVLPVYTFAAESPVIEVQSARAIPGGSADVQIQLKNNPGIGVAVIKVSFDNSLLTLDSFQYGSDFQKDGETPQNLRSPLTLTWSSTANVTGDKTYATLHFKVNENAEAGTDAEVKISSSDIYNIDEQKINFQIKNGKIEIKNGIPGDINADGVCDARDLLRMRKYFAGWDVEVDMVAVDVTGDGEVNAIDLLRMRKYFAGWDVEIYYGSTVMTNCSHNMVATPGKAATCTEPGNQAYWLCTNCLKYFSDSEGANEIQLSDVTIPATGHTIVTDPAVEATYTSEGKTEGSHCSVCGEVIVAQETIPKLQKREYSITYNISGNDTYLASQNIEMPEANVSKFTSDQEVVFEDLSCDGYTFLGWYDAYGNPMPKIEAGTARNITVYAKWETQSYPVVFNYDHELSGLLKESEKDKLENVRYKVNETKQLPDLSLQGYTFIGWTDETGNLCERINRGSTDEKQFYANFISNRNKAWTLKKTGDPYVFEDNDTIVYTYEIGKVENVPVYTINDFGGVISNGISTEQTQEVSAIMSEDLIEEYSSAVEKSTTGNATWTLSDGWTNIIHYDQEWLTAHETTEEREKLKSTTETGNWFVNQMRGGSSTTSVVDSTEAYQLHSQTKNRATFDQTDFSAHFDKTNVEGWNVGGELNLGAKEYIKGSASVTGVAVCPVGVGVAEAGVEAGIEFNQNLKLSAGYENKTTTNVGADGFKTQQVYTTQGSSDQAGIRNSHTSNTSNTSSWSNESGYGGSESTTESERIAKAVSETVSNKQGYGESYLTTGSSSETQGLSTTNANSDSYSSKVTYSKVTQEKTTVKWTTENAMTGYHRWVMAATSHVFGVVGYDKASKSYFTTTYSIMDDDLHSYQDYSYKNSRFDDNQSGVIDFCVPDDIVSHVRARMFATDGLEFDLDGNVTAYYGEDSAVVIPEFAVVDNLDGTARVVRVTGINPNVFTGNSNITGVMLSDFITSIPDREFEGCSELWDFTSYGVTEIGDQAFAGCEKLQSFDVTSDIVSLGEGAFASVDFVEVNANNSSVVEAAVKSGANNIVINLNEMTDTLDEKRLEIPEGTSSFVLRGYDNSYSNLVIVSDAETTKINRLTISSDNAIPLSLNSKDVMLCQLTSNSKGINTILNVPDSNLYIYGEVSINSEGERAMLARGTTVSKLEGNLASHLNVNGDLIYCRTLGGQGFINISNGEIIEVSEDEFDNLLQSFTLTFDPDGGTCEEASREVSNGVAVGELPIPAKEYYNFDGWYLEDGTQVTADTVFSNGQDQTVIAHWTHQTCEITFDINADDAEIPESSRTVNCGEAIGELPMPTRSYYSFDGWFTAPDGGERVTGATVLTTGDEIAFYAHWTGNTVTDWVLAVDAPDDAEIVDTKWTYKKRYYTENGASSLSGWTRYDSYVSGYGGTQGPVYYDPNGSNRRVWSESYETGRTHHWVYYRFANSSGSAGSYAESGTYWNYEEVDLTYELTQAGSSGGVRYYYNGSNYHTYWYAWEYDDISYGTRWYYQDPVYTYKYYQDKSLETTKDPTGQADVSNVVKYVKYRPREAGGVHHWVYYRYANSSGNAGSNAQSSTYTNYEEVDLTYELTQPGTNDGFQYFYDDVHYYTYWYAYEYDDVS